MATQTSNYKTFLVLVAFILVIFIGRTWLAHQFDPPRLFNIFDTLTVIGSIILLIKWHVELKISDWLIAFTLGIVITVGMNFAKLFSPYPFFGVVSSNFGQAWVRGIYTFLAALGGLTIMRRGGPIQFMAANRRLGKAARNFLFGFVIGIPLSVLNVVGLQFTTGRSIAWQSPLSALLDALQPAIVEEVIYRFALWGLLWLILQKSLPDKAVWLAGGLALLIHNYSHYDDLFVQSPLTAIGMGLVIALIWGLPPTLLANKRGMESAVAFHWVQDVARFLVGF